MSRETGAVLCWETPTCLSDRELKAAWRRYRKTRADGPRNRLMEHYLPTVKYCCEWLHAKLPSEVELDDVMSAGIEGLRRAIPSFDPKRQVRFETYLMARIRGAVLDYLRSIDWVPRLVRARAGKLAKTSDALSSQTGRPPSAGELARSMGLSQDEVSRILRDAHTVRCFSLDRRAGPEDGGREGRESDFVRDARTPHPAHAAHRKEVRDLVTRGLSPTERQVMVLYYYEEMTMREVGATLNLSESRVSQMHSAILERLRAKFQGRAFEFQAMDP